MKLSCPFCGVSYKINAAIYPDGSEFQCTNCPNSVRVDPEKMKPVCGENPFLEDFYNNPRQAALATQLFFLFQRVKYIQDLKQGDIFSSSKVSDFLLDKDMLFAKTTLSERELELYIQIYDYLSLDLPTPDLVVYLQADSKTLYQRIMDRGIDMEKNISYEYLQSLRRDFENFDFL